MFFERTDEIRNIARRCNAAVFVVPSHMQVELPGAILIQPEEKNTITIEQIRRMMSQLKLKQTDDVYVVIRPADKMGEEAANAFLKSLEEPSDMVHFVLITDSPSRLLPTVLSRASIYILKTQYSMSVEADDKMKELAKRLMVARGADLATVVEEICKKKDSVREYALGVLGVAIEMLQKSYMITGKQVFVVKLSQFIAVYDAIMRNGNIKLQMVAGLG